MKKKLAAAVAVLLVAVMCLSFASCKKDEDKAVRDTITSVMAALPTFDEKVLKKHAESSLVNTLNENLGLIPEGETIVKGLLDGMTYEISTEEGAVQIDTDPQGAEKNVSATATAKITITSKDLKKEAASYQLKVYAGVVAGTMDLTNKTFLQEQVTKALAVINSETVEKTATPMTLSLEKRSGKWVVLLDGAAQNAAFGNAGSAFNQVVSYVARVNNGTFGKGGIVDTTAPKA